MAAGAQAAGDVSHGATPTGPTGLIQPLRPGSARLSESRAVAIFLADPKVAAWLRRYPAHPAASATYLAGIWTVSVTSGAAGEIATGTVEDSTAIVTTAWTGPQVAWSMARGEPGAFGGTRINSLEVWLGFCAIFLIGLVDWRRPLSLRNADLVMMLSFSVSLWFFNRGNIFAAMPLAYPGMVWLLVRCVWVGVTDRAPRGRVVWPAWVLVGLTVFLIGFRIGLNVETSNVIDVGYSGVIGASLIAHGQSPYGNFPYQGALRSCTQPAASGDTSDRIQPNGRCETANPNGDTYGPFAYEAYLPAYLVFGWSGLWDSLPAAHATSILWDLLCVAGLWMVGRRYGGADLAAALAFAWVAWPFSQYASNSNTNDMIQPALLVWGFYFAGTPLLRGGLNALAAATKFAPLVVAPLWLGYPTVRGRADRALYLCGFAFAGALSLSVLLFEPSVWGGITTFIHRTFGYQLGRAAPFSVWDWRQYHARGLPNLHLVQNVLQVALVVGALSLGRWPAKRSPLQLAAFTAALLIGFECVLTYWIYLYLPWFFPFAAFALIASNRTPTPESAATAPDGGGLLAPA